MSFVRKIITGAVVAVGTELIVNRALPALIKKGKKIVKELEKKAQEKGE